MTSGSRDFIHRLSTGLVAALLAVSVSTASAWQDPTAESSEPAEEVPTTQPRLPTHAQLVESVSKQPLRTPEMRSADGKPLTDAQKSEVREAEKTLANARAARMEGNYGKAGQLYVEASAALQKVLGTTNFLSVTASVESAIVDRFLMMSAERQDALRESDKQELAGTTALKESQFMPARVAAAKALEIREKILGKDSPDLIEPLRVLGAAQTELRALDDSERLLNRALTLCEMNFGKNHPRTALVLDRIGWLRIYQAENEKAAESLRRALFILNATVGETADTAETMDNLGTALGYTNRADMVEAVNHKLRALVIRERVLGPKAKDTAVSLSNLAWLYGRMRLFDEMIPLRKQAIEIFEAKLGPDHRDTIIEKANLAQAYRSMGKIDESMKLYAALVEMDEKAGNQPTQSAVNHLTMLGTVCLESGKQKEGVEAMRKAVEKAVALFDAGEYGAAVAEMEQIAMAYQSRRMLEDALAVRRKVNEWDVAQHARVSELLLQRNIKLGQLYNELSMASEGVEHLRKTVADAKTFYGDGERETTLPLLAFAGALIKAKELDEASRICTEVLRVVEQKFQKDSVSNVYALRTMGRIQMEQKNYDLARFSFEEGLRILDDDSRETPVIRVGLLGDLTRCLLQIGDLKEAAKIMREALQTCRELKSPYPMQVKSLHAETAKLLLDVLDKDPAADAAEKNKLRDELKKLLEELRDGGALLPEMREWMKDLGVSPGA